MIQSTADFLPVLPESGHLGSSILYFHPPTITKKGRLLDTIEYTTSSVYLVSVVTTMYQMKDLDLLYPLVP